MLKIDRRLIAHFDWPLLLAVLLLLAVGLVTVLSATHTEEKLVSGLFWRQLSWVALGLVALCAVLPFDYHVLKRWGWVFYVFTLILLILVVFVGTIAGGARRWISVAGFSMQPSEFAKLAVIIMTASFLHHRVSEDRLHWRPALVALGIAALPAALILKQPDLGTAMVVLSVGVLLLLVAGLSLRWVAAAILIAVPVFPYVWQHLKPYQQRRLLMFLDPERDPLGNGYHIIQSKIAIGSGMWGGKGLFRGTQYRLNFLPEQHTDFIFSVFAEEWGFVGACVLLGLYLFLLYRCWVAIHRARDAFGVLLAFGVTTMIFLQVLVNVMMAAGALPVVGVTLPFLSYGGSSLLACMMGIGLLLNISMRRFTF
ncbi:MAG: rod shape-determining protein RodA [Candidatus Binatia bacterium]|nr:MAG: rod shape-determining protein RodA [Candidatus Binatia bacterium]